MCTHLDWILPGPASLAVSGHRSQSCHLQTYRVSLIMGLMCQAASMTAIPLLLKARALNPDSLQGLGANSAAGQ